MEENTNPVLDTNTDAQTAETVELSHEEQNSSEEFDKVKDEEILHEPESSTPFKTFKTKEEYQSDVDRIFNSRFKDYKLTKSKYDDLVKSVKQLYKTDDEAEALENLSKGFDKKQDDKDLPSSSLDKSEEAVHQEDEMNQIKTRLFDEESKIKQRDPEFSISTLVKSDEEFKNDLINSGSVYFAYSNHKLKGIPKRSFREAGVGNLSGGKVNMSVKDYTDEDFESYIKKIEGIF